MSITLRAFQLYLQEFAAAQHYLIAYSGGVDSHVLLHLCAQLKKAQLSNTSEASSFSFSAAYIDHGLSPNAKKWGQHCQQVCFELGIPLSIIEVDGRAKKGMGPEASARIARYQAFSDILSKNEILLTAQHQDDQAETLLLQLLRGSGVKGLSAMPRIKPFAQGFLCRPVLDYKKQELLDYARQHQLHWIEDESNEQQCFERNYLRHSVLPLLEKHWPSVRENFAKSAEVLAESQSLLDKMALADSRALLFIDSSGKIHYDKLLLQPALDLLEQDQNSVGKWHKSARLNNVLRHWIHSNHFPLPSKKVLQQIISNVLQARQDAMPLVSWQRDEVYCAIRRYQDKLYLLDSIAIVRDRANYLLNEDKPVELAYNNGTIKCISDINSAINNAFERNKLFSKVVSIRYRNGGERYRRTVSDSSRSLKHWFQEQAVPPWERQQMPLIFWGNELIQIGNTIVSHQLYTENQKGSAQQRVVIFWQKEKR